MLGGDLRCELFHKIPTRSRTHIRSFLHRYAWLHHQTVHLERKGSFTEDTVRIYVAEIGSALSFLHEKRIIHR